MIPAMAAGELDVAALTLRRTIDAQRELGFLKADLDIRKYADLSVVEEAAARLE